MKHQSYKLTKGPWFLAERKTDGERVACCKVIGDRGNKYYITIRPNAQCAREYRKSYDYCTSSEEQMMEIFSSCRDKAGKVIYLDPGHASKLDKSIGWLATTTPANRGDRGSGL